MDHFGGKRLSQLSPDEIRVLVDRKTAEDQQLDFKSKVWTDNEDGRFELLHDVTALANADGGYLLALAKTKQAEIWQRGSLRWQRLHGKRSAFGTSAFNTSTHAYKGWRLSHSP
jgi:hypothetical protein